MLYRLINHFLLSTYTSYRTWLKCLTSLEWSVFFSMFQQILNTPFFLFSICLIDCCEDYLSKYIRFWHTECSERISYYHYYYFIALLWFNCNYRLNICLLYRSPHGAVVFGCCRWGRCLWAAGQPLFWGHALLLTNTLDCGAVIANPGCARRWWEIPGLLSQKFNPLREHVCSGLQHQPFPALLSPLVRPPAPRVLPPKYPQEGPRRPAGGISHAVCLVLLGSWLPRRPVSRQELPGAAGQVLEILQGWLVHVACCTIGEFLLRATPVLSQLHQWPDAELGHIPFLPEVPSARPPDDSRLSGPGHCADCA